MKTKKLTPRNSAPVQREKNTATVARDGNAIAPAHAPIGYDPFAGDDAE